MRMRWWRATRPPQGGVGGAERSSDHNNPSNFGDDCKGSIRALQTGATSFLSMPELPEVEVTRLGFADRIAGAQVRAVHLGKPLRWGLGIDPDELVDRRVLTVRRRGKYLLIDLDCGLLLLHLGMSGSLRFSHALPEAGKHDHFELVTDRGTLRLNDPRRFGAV